MVPESDDRLRGHRLQFLLQLHTRHRLPVDEAWSVNLSSSTAKKHWTIPRRPLDVVLRPHQLQLRQPLLSDRQPAPRRLRPLRQNNRWGTFPSANVMWRPTTRLSYVTPCHYGSTMPRYAPATVCSATTALRSSSTPALMSATR